MSPSPPTDSAPRQPPAHGARRPGRGFGATLRAAIDGGAQAGFLGGLLDGLVVRGLQGAPRNAIDLLGCLGAAGLVYGFAFALAALASAPLLHPFLRKHSRGGRTRIVFGLGLGSVLFLELFWWTRPYVFYGVAATDPRRVAAGLALLALSLGLGWWLARVWARRGRALQTALPLAMWAFYTAGALYLLGSGGPNTRGVLNERNRERPNVLLVIVDALRQDVLGCYGNERVQTPGIDALARRGVVFENAFVQAPYTWTSFGSLLTGKYPRRHGLVKMLPGVRMLPNVTLPWHLKSAVSKDGQQFEDADWASGTFMTGTLSHGSGLMRGFDTYFEALVGHDRVDLDSAWSLFRSDLLLSRIKNKLGQKLDSSLVITTATDWLDEIAGRRFVAMVHLYSTHTPYDPPAEFRELYVDPAYDGPMTAFYADHRYALESGEYTATDADEQQIRNLYYAGVTQADAAIGVLLERLELQGVLDDTLVIITADHGEELGEHRLVAQGGEHGLWEHNYMFQSNLRIPLVMAWPAGLPEGVRVAAIVDSIDLLPTVSDLLELELPDDTLLEAEYAKIDGVSLVPLVLGEAREVRPFSFAENGTHKSVQDRRWKLVVGNDLLEEGAFERALLSPEPRLDGDRELRLFDLAQDPGEFENLARVAGSRPESEAGLAARSLFAALAAWDAAMPIARAQVVRSHRDLENAANLGALGYAEEVGGDFEVVEDDER